MSEGRVALVTGASRGIGRCGAIALASRGYDVAITARTVHEGDSREGSVVIPGSLDTTAAEIEALGRKVLPIPMDIMDRESIRAGFDRTIAEWGRVDVLVNNAPYSGPGTTDRILDIDPATATRIVEADYVNQLYLTQLALPGMVAQGGGTIINLGSGSALMAPPGPVGAGGWSLTHCAAKAAFHQLAVITDVEFRDKGVRTFTLEPGYTVTERRIALDKGNEYEGHFRGDPPEVTGAVIGWLADEPAADDLLGGMVHAQVICKRNNLLPGWPPPR